MSPGSVENLKQLGLNDYEARAYLALLQRPGTTGYEIARTAGLPRARVYEVLEALVRKGAAVAHQEEDRQLYHPTSPDTFLASRERHVRRVVASLALELTRTGSRLGSLVFHSLRGRRRILEGCRHLCRRAARRLFVTGWPEDLAELLPDFQEAGSRGVGVYGVVYGEAPGSAPWPGLHWFSHGVSPMQHLQLAVLGRWIGVVADMEEVVVGQVQGAEPLAVRTRNGALVMAVASFVWHDALFRVVEDIAAREGITFPKELADLGTAMWSWEPVDRASPGGDAGDEARRLLALVAERLRAAPDLVAGTTGVMEFTLEGEGGGSFLLDLDTRPVVLREGASPEAALAVRMSVGDFVELVRGTLPASAIHERGRLQVRGDPRLAAALPALLTSEE